VVPVVERMCLVLAALVALWFTWFHGIIVRANVAAPPRLSVAPVAIWAASMVVLAVAWPVVLRLRAGRASRSGS
jgi:hypothetical protein